MFDQVRQERVTESLLFDRRRRLESFTPKGHKIKGAANSMFSEAVCTVGVCIVNF